MIKILIVEDEIPVQKTISEIIEKNCTGTEIIGFASNIKSAKFLIENNNPDLVLLDINLPDGTSFELLQQLDKIEFKIIFITAFEEYALKAIKLSAVDYLVKPVDPIELIESIIKAKQSLHNTENNVKMDALFANIKELSGKTRKIVLKTAENIFLIDIQDIIRCESEGAYTMFYINDGRRILISKVLKDYEDILNDNGFIRVHKSHIVNIKFIDRFEKLDGGSIILKGNKSIPVSIRKKDQLIRMFDQLSQF